MKEPDPSRAAPVEDARIATALADPAGRRILFAFVREDTVAAVAKRLGLPLSRVHYRVVRLSALGLLRVVEMVPRRGRAVRKYRTAAEAFLVPERLLPARGPMALEQALREDLERVGREDMSAGVLFAADAEGRPLVRRTGGSATGPGFQMWMTIVLTPADARRLGAELRDVIQRFAERPRTQGGKPHLVHAAVAGHQPTGRRRPAAG